MNNKEETRRKGDTVSRRNRRAPIVAQECPTRWVCDPPGPVV
jgi:hypothetical protein